MARVAASIAVTAIGIRTTIVADLRVIFLVMREVDTAVHYLHVVVFSHCDQLRAGVVKTHLQDVGSAGRTG